jgi:hypothetical protein
MLRKTQIALALTMAWGLPAVRDANTVSTFRLQEPPSAGQPSSSPPKE